VLKELEKWNQEFGALNWFFKIFLFYNSFIYIYRI
jgi:hypothetical protein